MASSKRRSSWSSLPPELIEEILYRTPAESLIRLESTCKQWYALITDKRFIYNHLRRSPERFLRTVDQTVQIMDPVTGKSSSLPIPNEFHGHAISTMVHCDGLMLCRCNDRERYARLAIWNPVLGKMRWIDPSQCFTKSDYYGIGYDNKKPRDGYKILRFSDRRWDPPGIDYDGEAKAEIYEFKTNSWKTLKYKVDWDVEISCKGVAVMGNMYWIIQYKHRDFILGFDFSDERFKAICVCPRTNDNYLSCFNGDRLSLLWQGERSRQIDVWVSNKLADDGKVSFSKYFSVAASRPDLPALQVHGTDMDHPVYCFGKHRKSIIAWCEGAIEEEGGKMICTCLTLYEIDEGGLRKQIETRRNYECGYGVSFLCGYVYVPSLIPLPKIRGG